jgi:dTDP-4-dehydrorhamnose reductase
MNVLILGITGMLGHKLWQVIGERRPDWKVFGTVRRIPGGPERVLFDPYCDWIIQGVHGADFDSLIRAFAVARPDVVVNCIGIIKLRASAREAVPSIAVNSLLPHRLVALSYAAGARFIHISTDCVFAGTRGGYREDDVADAMDLYGRSKHLGEVASPGALTLRTSIIGREINSAAGLVEWFLSNRLQAGGSGTADGFHRAVFSGLTTLELSRTIRQLIDEQPVLSGLYHVSAEAIDKHSLLCSIGEAWQAGVDVRRSDRVIIDRSLDSRRFREACGWSPPDWASMIADMVADPTPYDEWRQL